MDTNIEIHLTSPQSGRGRLRVHPKTKRPLVKI